MFKLEEKGGEASFSIYATRLLNQTIFYLRISRRVQRRILLGRDCNPLEEALNPFNALVRKRKRVATYGYYVSPYVVGRGTEQTL